MSDIKMSDVFELPLTDPVALEYLGSESNAKDAVLEAINAYDANQEKIGKLYGAILNVTNHSIELSGENEKQQQEIAELKAQIEGLTSKANTWDRVWGEISGHKLIREVAASHGLSGNCSCASILLDAFEQASEALDDNNEESIESKQQAIRDAIFNSEQVELQGQGYVGTYVSLEDLEINILQLVGK